MTESPVAFQSQSLAHNGIAHGFFTRQGGVSEGIYGSLNCGPGSSDDRPRVIENRRRASAALAPNTNLVTLYQVHSAHAVTVTQPWDIPANPKADALVTDRPHIALGILTADCAPILLADPEAHVIGAAHAGWKGAFQGVAESVVTAMLALGARRERVRATIGPCISQPAYEVGPEFFDRFRTAGPDTARFFTPSTRPHHWQFDLPAYVAARLTEAGIASVQTLSSCTYTQEAEFFSFRRTTHRKEPDYGRQLSAIMLTG